MCTLLMFLHQRMTRWKRLFNKKIVFIMAFQPNKTTGKAIADVKALYFLKHEESGEPLMVDALDANNALSASWFPVLSLKGTVNASQDAPSIEKILVDQFDAPIGITTEPGDFTFEVQLPSMAENDIAEWLGAELHKHEGKSIDGKQLLSFNLNGTIIETSVMIKTGTGAFIVFSNCQVVLTFMKEDKVFGFRLSGQVLAAENPENDMIYIATEKMPVAVTDVTLNKSTLTLANGSEETLVATVAPANASNKGIVWTSSNDSKASVDENGKVTALAASGTVTITATSAADNTKSASCTVTLQAAA